MHLCTYISKYLLIEFVFFIVGLGLGGSVSFPKVADLESIYCQLLYSRDQTFVPLVETNTDEFLCTYKTHCFALCHCCEYDACDCEMTCPDNCTCYHDNSWSKNIAECSGKQVDFIIKLKLKLLLIIDIDKGNWQNFKLMEPDKG